MADITPTTRAAVLFRANGRCEWCGRWTQALQLHHRLFRSRRYRADGGDLHGGDNLVALCGSGNHTGCHGRAHGAAAGDLEAAVEAGISIPSGGSPSAIPIMSVWFGFAVLLLPNGDYEPADVPTIPERETAADPKVDRRGFPHE